MMNTKPTKTFLIADDHQLIRSGMRAILESLSPGCHILETDTAVGVQALLKKNPGVDLLMLDLGLKDSNGTDIFQVIGDMVPNKTICILTGETNPIIIERCIEFGVIGYLPKTLTDDALLACLQQILQGKSWFPDYVLQRDEMREKFSLSKKQLAILQDLAHEKSPESIASSRNLTTHAIHYHIKNIIRKMDVKNRFYAVQKAREEGLIQ